MLSMLMGPRTALGNIPRGVEHNVDGAAGLIGYMRGRNLTRARSSPGAVGAGLLSNGVDTWFTGVNSNAEGEQTGSVARHSGGGGAPGTRAGAGGGRSAEARVPSQAGRGEPGEERCVPLACGTYPAATMPDRPRIEGRIPAPFRSSPTTLVRTTPQRAGARIAGGMVAAGTAPDAIELRVIEEGCTAGEAGPPAPASPVRTGTFPPATNEEMP